MNEQKEVRWLSIKEASEEFDVSEHIIRRLIRQFHIETKDDVIDTRRKLVDAEKLKEVLGK